VSGLRVEQHTKYNVKKDPKNSTQKDGVPLDELLEFLITAQSHGIPNGACVRIVSGYSDYSKIIEIHWSEDR
jgi:hypothetical protein